MQRSLFFPLLALALVACGDQLDPVVAGSNTVHISEDDPTANGTLTGSVLGVQYGTGWDTVSAPLEGVTVEVYQIVPDSEMLMSSPDTVVVFDTLPRDTVIVIDTLPGDTVIVIDTLPVDSMVVDTLPPELPATLLLRGTGVTDAEGRFSVTGIPAGQYVIFIVPAGSSQWAPSTGWTFISDGASSLAGTFHLWLKSGSGLD